jgi:hypothetical protein
LLARLRWAFGRLSMRLFPVNTDNFAFNSVWKFVPDLPLKPNRSF